jgi:UDP-2-acetamido-3-amino-2,3-dideoxy-glucuronate N-acetyltransferase
MSQIHPTAIIDDGAELGEGTRVWHWVHVCPGAIIGKSCSLGQNVFVGNKVVIGNNVKIQNNVSVYDDVILEDDVFCGPSMVFTNVYNPRASIVRKEEYRKTHVKKGATIGANATIVCGVTIGRFAFIGAGSVVTKDVPDFALVVGNPARQIAWMSRFGERLVFECKNGQQTDHACCPHTGDEYILYQGKVFLSTDKINSAAFPEP